MENVNVSTTKKTTKIGSCQTSLVNVEVVMFKDAPHVH